MPPDDAAERRRAVTVHDDRLDDRGDVVIPGAAPTSVELETEMAVLGAVLESPRLAAMLLERLEAEDFARPAHQVIYGLIVDIAAGGQEPSYLTVSQAA